MNIILCVRLSQVGIVIGTHTHTHTHMHMHTYTHTNTHTHTHSQEDTEGYPQLDIDDVLKIDVSQREAKLRVSHFHNSKKEYLSFSRGFKPRSFRLLVRRSYHRATDIGVEDII